ncbi:MAG: bifunctional hydroxymethylpyrimidine kinase/phosphomethylpyrimidine kinase [Lachnospiraceae bacterium]|nr:bifunctional hydroxymethylpyrimidine kinase/phosphomethylpyrimidine kinase [Lachnospiraceae bacterium]
MKDFDPRLYFITDSTDYDDETFLRRVEQALRGGVTMVQLREKTRSAREFTALAGKVHALTKQYGVPLIIDDRIDVALAVDAEGVHVGQSDIPVDVARRLMGDDKIVGATAKTVPQALEAYRQGADYLGVGAVYPTSTKKDTRVTPPETIRDIAEAVPVPVAAIGGLNADNLSILSGIPVAGICVVSAIMKAADPERAAGELLVKARELTAGREPEKAGALPKGMKTALSIAGSDSSGGAGIQADIKTMTMNGVFAMTAVTALTAQNTTGVRGIEEVSPEFLAQQIDAVFTDIRPDAVKIGMVASSELIRVIAERLRYYHAANVTVDPVMVATSGSSLLKNDAVEAMISELLPLATVITPNIPEAEVLSGMKITGEEDMKKAAERIGKKCGCAVLLKGGHSINDANDLLYADGAFQWFCGRRIANPNTHGTGCTLSSAIASNLAKGFPLTDAVQLAKEYISGALSAQLDLGKGSGPMKHNFDLKSRFAAEYAAKCGQ